MTATHLLAFIAAFALGYNWRRVPDPMRGVFGLLFVVWAFVIGTMP